MRYYYVNAFIVRYNLYVIRLHLLIACKLLFVVAKISYLIFVFLSFTACFATTDFNVIIPVTLLSLSDFLSSYCHILLVVSLVPWVTFFLVSLSAIVTVK